MVKICTEDVDSKPEFKSVKIKGTITEEERLFRVRRFFSKKERRNLKNYHYLKRRTVAEKRLRLKGRFVTTEQAYEILGLPKNKIISSQEIQELLN